MLLFVLAQKFEQLIWINLTNTMHFFFLTFAPKLQYVSFQENILCDDVKIVLISLILHCTVKCKS